MTAASESAQSLPPPGCPAFFPAVLNHVREQAPGGYIDPVILQSLLLCCVAGNKNLILRTSEDDIAHVLKLSSAILASAFGYSTHKLRIRPSVTSERAFNPSVSSNRFLQSLFIHHSSAPEKGKRRAPGNKHKNSRSANNVKPGWSSSFNDVERQQPTPPNDGYATVGRASGSSFVSEYTIDTTTNTTSRYSVTSTLKHAESDRRRATTMHGATEPVMAISGDTFEDRNTFEFPKALVMSGIEHASAQSQRALINMLNDRQVVLHKGGDETPSVHNLPEGFILVYVCAADSRERPAIHKTLLDKFAMSVNVTLAQEARSGLKSSGMLTPLQSPQPLPGTISHLSSPIRPSSTAPSANPSITPSLLNRLQQRYKSTTIAPSLSVYASDLFTAARHDQRLDGTLLTARSMQDALDLARAARVLGVDLTGSEFLRELARQNNRSPEDSSQSDLSQVYEDIASGQQSLKVNFFPLSNETLVRSKGTTHESSVLRKKGDATSSILTQEIYEGIDVDSLDVSQADIARVIPRVMSHRLRVRDGPEDAVLGSALYGSLEWARLKQVKVKDEGRSTVKAVLVQILAQV